MSASIVSRVSVNTASAVTSAFVADSSNSSIGVADARFAARRSSSTLARFKAFSASASACRQSFCVVLTRGHHVRHLYQCPEVVSLTRQATSCRVPSEEERFLCTPQSVNHWVARLAPRCSTIDFCHERKSTLQLSQV